MILSATDVMNWFDVMQIEWLAKKKISQGACKKIRVALPWWHLQVSIVIVYQ